jgi:AraC-like DNA-binding protein
LKIQFEAIKPDPQKSFHLMVNPRLNNFFFWHFHPEVELVYIKGTDGIRHVGDHVSRYTASDLVLIGSGVPHLNFDYGVRSEYQKIVVHFPPDFLQSQQTKSPELEFINPLFTVARRGIAINGELKSEIGARLISLDTRTPFDQWIELLIILKKIDACQQLEFLHQQPFINKTNQLAQDRLQDVFTYMQQHYDQKISLDRIASVAHLSREAFCRYFKKMTQMNWTDFLNQYRVNQAKKMLVQGHRVGEAADASGFESLSYFNRTFKKIVGTNPIDYRKEYQVL